jgi:hypothetical protein
MSDNGLSGVVNPFPKNTDAYVYFNIILSAGTSVPLKDDILWGAEEIAAHFGMIDRRPIYNYVEKSRFPFFRIGKNTIAARKSVISAWIMAQELQNVLAGVDEPANSAPSR